jgi:hypothetical protein
MTPEIEQFLEAYRAWFAARGGGAHTDGAPTGINDGDGDSGNNNPPPPPPPHG